MCKVGARVVGCCAHISSLVWYLAYARCNPNELQQRSSLYSNHILDVEEEESDDDIDADNDDDSHILYALMDF